MLWTEFGMRVPAGIEENKDGSYMVTSSDREERINPVLESLGALFPNKIVEEDAHRVHAYAFSPTEFAVDSYRVECICLPHLKLVDGI
jgi:hypothetical protein